MMHLRQCSLDFEQLRGQRYTLRIVRVPSSAPSGAERWVLGRRNTQLRVSGESRPALWDALDARAATRRCQ